MKLILPSKDKIMKTSIDDSGPDRYYSRNPLVRYIYLKRLELSIKILGNEKFDNILEVGCGGGILAPTLTNYGKNVFAIDIHDKLNIVKKNIGGDFLRGSVFKIPLKQGGIDCILCLSVLEHLDNMEKALLEINASLSSNGKVIFGIPSDNVFIKLWFMIKKSPALKSHINSKEHILNEIEKIFETEKRKDLNIGPIGPINLYTVIRCCKKKQL